MSFLAFILIFGSAIFHATWNMIAKKEHMSVAFYTILCSCGMIAWCHVPFWTPIPIFQLPVAFWLCMAGMVLSELCYCSGLSLTYSKVDMVTAYPMVRSLPILLTAGITSAIGLGAPLTRTACMGFIIVFIGAMMMPLKSFSDFSTRKYLNWNILLILFTALGTTGYTIFDKTGQGYVRAAAPEVSALVISLTYYSIRALCLASSLWIFTLCHKNGRTVIKNMWREKNWHAAFAGICGSLTYVLVLIAMNFVSNVSYVQVFRQLGLPVGMAAGVFILKEKSAVIKWIGVALIIAGLIICVL